jgi:hypothetical protein
MFVSNIPKVHRIRQNFVKLLISKHFIYSRKRICLKIKRRVNFFLCLILIISQERKGYVHHAFFLSECARVVHFHEKGYTQVMELILKYCFVYFNMSYYTGYAQRLMC